MLRSPQSIALNGPGTPKLRKPDPFRPQSLLAANTPINAFSRNGLFYASNIGSSSERRSITQMINDSNIIKQ